METIGERIRKFRKERGLTQKQLGERCGILEPNIRKYELDKQKPKLDTLEKIAKALDVDINVFWDYNYFKSELDDIFTTMYVRENETRKALQKYLLEGFEKLNILGMKELLDYLEELLKDEFLLSTFYGNEKLKEIVKNNKK